eukprot:8213664-Alexandrium_andersonii.AAC.1
MVPAASCAASPRKAPAHPLQELQRKSTPRRLPGAVPAPLSGPIQKGSLASGMGVVIHHDA